MYAFSGILTALYNLERNEIGATLEISMLDALGEWMSQPLYYGTENARQVSRTGARHASIAPYGPYVCGSGQRVFIAIQNDREWATLCTRLLGRPELIQDRRFKHNPERVDNNEELTRIIESAFSHWTVTEVIKRLDSVGIANGMLRTVAELGTHPQLQARGRWRQVLTSAGPVPALLPPVIMRGYEAVMGDVPGLGEHNAAIRTEFGLMAQTSGTAEARD